MKTETWFDQYNQFADACSIPQGSLIEPPNIEAITLARKLVREEWNTETEAALAGYLQNPSLENLVEVADGIGDSIYVLCQLARSLGIPLNAVFASIQSANMAKVVESPSNLMYPQLPKKYTVLRREDGKILKPEGWTPPDIWKVLKEHSDKLCVEHGKMGAENWTPTSVQFTGEL